MNLIARSVDAHDVPVRVVVADDDQLLRESIGHLLNGHPDIDVIGYATHDREVISVCENLQADVALVALQPPTLDAIAVTPELHNGGARVIGMTAAISDREIFEALRVGIDGLLLRRCSSDELVHAIRVVGRGDAVLAPTITRQLVDHCSHPATAATSVAAAYQLTAREIDVLRELGGGASNAQIAERLQMSETTAKSHVSHLLAKTGCTTRLQAVVFAFSAGLLTNHND